MCLRVHLGHFSPLSLKHFHLSLSLPSLSIMPTFPLFPFRNQIATTPIQNRRASIPPKPALLPGQKEYKNLLTVKVIDCASDDVTEMLQKGDVMGGGIELDEKSTDASYGQPSSSGGDDRWRVSSGVVNRWRQESQAQAAPVGHSDSPVRRMDTLESTRPPTSDVVQAIRLTNGITHFTEPGREVARLAAGAPSPRPHPEPSHAPHPTRTLPAPSHATHAPPHAPPDHTRRHPTSPALDTHRCLYTPRYTPCYTRYYTHMFTHRNHHAGEKVRTGRHTVAVTGEAFQEAQSAQGDGQDEEAGRHIPPGQGCQASGGGQRPQEGAS